MIKLVNVCKNYGKREILKNINLEIISPGIYSFIGDNGVGKTTLFNLINKNIKPTSGKVINTSKNSAFVFQNINLINHLTIKEHFIMHKIDYKILKKFKLYQKLNNYPFELSFGQKQRIAIILLIYSSRLIFLDEPTSHLDKENTRLIMREIKKISKDKIILLISHDLEMIEEYSDAIYKIENSKLKIIKENNKISIFKDKKKKMNFKGYSSKSIRFYKKINLTFSFIFLFLSFMLILANTIKYNINYLLKDSEYYSLDYNKFYLKECEEVIQNKITIKKCYNVSKDKKDMLNNLGYKVGYNYDLLMNDLYSTTKFSVISKTDYKLIEGDYPLAYNEIIVSEEKYKIGDLIDLESFKLIEFDKVDIYKNKLTLKVVGITKEDFFLKNKMFYLDYDLLEEYLKKEKLLNNNIDLYSYFKSLNIDNYKYVLYFNDIDLSLLNTNNIEYLANYDYYNDIKDINKQISKCLNYLNLSIIIFSFYYAIKLIRKKALIKEDEITFLKASGIKKKKISKLINKEQRRLIIISYLLSILINIIICNIVFREVLLNIKYLLLSLILILFINKLITKMILARRCSM